MQMGESLFQVASWMDQMERNRGEQPKFYCFTSTGALWPTLPMWPAALSIQRKPAVDAISEVAGQLSLSAPP